METSLNQTWATDYVKGVRGWEGGGKGGGEGVRWVLVTTQSYSCSTP